jgi:hypothetical protein
MARVATPRSATARVSVPTPARRHAAAVRSPVHREDSGLERLKNLEVRLALARAGSDERLGLTGAIHIEADAYRKSLDAEQAKAAQGRLPEPATVARASRRRASRVPRRSAPRR